jgi:superfamily II DNA helicase RecQ
VGLKDVQHTQVQEEWLRNTVAFGMGIDLANVRYVIHWTMSKRVKGFYQELGQAR